MPVLTQRAVLLAALILSLLLCAGATPGAGETKQAAPRVREVSELQGLAERWEGAMKEMMVPGMAVAIVKDGKVLAVDGFGRRNPEGDPVTPETMFYIASMTKPYTAMGLAILAEEGKVELDAPVRNYLPRFELADAQATESITVRDLLCHKPGLSEDLIVFLDAYSGQITDETYYRQLKLVRPPNQTDYSNVHYTLAGRVIEAVSGKKWQDFLDERIFDPAGMPRTTAYASVMYGDDNHAVPMILLDGKMTTSPLQKSDRTMHAAGGMGSTAIDGARWLILNMNKGEIDAKRIVSAEMAQQMQTRQSSLARPEGQIRVMEGFGLGWQMGSYKRQFEPFFAHGGGYVGAASYMAMLPEQGIGVYVMANTSEAGSALCAMVMVDTFERLLGVTEPEDLLPGYIRTAREQIPKGPRTPAGPRLGAEQLPEPLTAYEGAFRNEDWGSVEFKVDQGHLGARMGDLVVRLFPADARPVTEPAPKPRLGVSLEAGSGTGLLVVGVNDGSPAQRIGLKEGDRITHANGQAVTDSITEALAATPPGGTLNLKVVRDGQSHALEGVLPAAPPADAPKPSVANNPHGFYGWIAPGMDLPGRFIVEGSKVVAVEMEMQTGQPVRFDRATD